MVCVFSSDCFHHLMTSSGVDCPIRSITCPKMKLCINILNCKSLYKIYGRHLSRLSYDFGISSEPLISKTIPDVLRDAVILTPDKLCIASVHQDIHKTYQELNRDVSEICSA